MVHKLAGSKPRSRRECPKHFKIAQPSQPNQTKRLFPLYCGLCDGEVVKFLERILSSASHPLASVNRQDAKNAKIGKNPTFGSTGSWNPACGGVVDPEKRATFSLGWCPRLPPFGCSRLHQAPRTTVRYSSFSMLPGKTTNENKEPFWKMLP